ncbi:Asp23/Gls24 family envelope stress response protein [Kineococcus sp. SYSU DK002]|uniref:hypothetical protein n=1 Tax=Kineococcus sp. SYSU DK002 TaxID=3383123 RepID=UPI003D7CE0B4
MSPQGPDVAELADALALTVRQVPGVARLNAGVLEEIGTYLPGRRVGGVRVPGTLTAGPDAEPVEVHVVLHPGTPIRETARDVHAAVAGELARHHVEVPVRVHVDDLAD